ncbi:MAG TPA: phosphoribosylamine--glycine ligase [Acidimicrobiales bacterium]|nr:phosphoribosylamine--glycine ligase [Acidimicrobiales bacterium]
MSGIDRICVVGAGGREHALAQTLSRHAEVVVTPGNPGMATHAGGVNEHGAGGVSVTSEPAEGIDADLFVIGPEAPLVEGLADRLRATGRLVLGPGADGARLEGSKAWMKEMCSRARVPTARYGAFTEVGPALEFLDELASSGCSLVVKTDGLAAGKGVLVTPSREEAAEDVRAKLSGRSFGAAGTTVVLEEGLVGEEVTVLAVCDGRDFSVLPASQDHKRVGDGDTGANTGGMGAYSPVSHIAPAELDRAVRECVAPMLAALRADGIDYRGVLYAGLILTASGPRIIEYNVRLGDPEAEAVVPLLDGDVGAWLASAAAGAVDGDAQVSSDTAVTVVMCADGYGTPDGPRTGDEISGLEAAGALAGVTVFHAGTLRDPNGRFYTAGGRVLAVTARRPDLAAARERVYEAVSMISWSGAHYRRDIGARALRREGAVT